MKRLLLIAVLFFGITRQAHAQEQTPQPTTGTTQMKFVNLDTVYDFGDIPAGVVAQYQFEFKNTGNEPLVITDVHCGVQNMSFTWPKKPVKPGKKGVIIVRYPTQDIGSFKDDVVITSNATTDPYPFLHVSGGVVPATSAGTAPSTPVQKSGHGRHAPGQ